MLIFLFLSGTERLNTHFDEWFQLSGHLSWMGFGSRWKSPESMCWDREQHAGSSWRHAVGINCHGWEGSSRIGYWEKPNWRATSWTGLVSLLGSSENGMTCLQSLNGGEEMRFFICHPGKGERAAWGKATTSNKATSFLQSSFASSLCLRGGPLYRGMNAPLTVCPYEAYMWRKDSPHLTLE